jgi:hypothetical protein
MWAVDRAWIAKVSAAFVIFEGSEMWSLSDAGDASPSKKDAIIVPER